MNVVYNSQTFDSAPTTSGANIQTATIPTSAINGTVVLASDNTNWTGINTFAQQPVTSFTTDPGSTSNLLYGYQAGASLTTGTTNTIFCYQGGAATTSGANNTILGVSIYTAGTSGNGNTILSMTSATSASFSGSNNTILSNAMTTTLTSGSGNTCCGRSSMAAIATASNSTSLGGGSFSTGDFSSSTSIGNGCSVAAANNVSVGTTATFAYFPGTVTAKGSAIFMSSIKVNSATTVVSCSSSGNVTYSQPFTGSAIKKVYAYCNAAVGTASYTFPVAFTQTPTVVTTNGPAASVVTALSTTAITITGATTTGSIFIEGF